MTRRLRAKYGDSKLLPVQAILKEYYPAGPIGKIFYSNFMWYLMGSPQEYITSMLKYHSIPDTMTSRADFAAAKYWHDRKQGPPPEEYVVRRHSVRPYQ